VIALSLTVSLNGMEMSSSGSTSDSRYEVPLGPMLGPMIDESGCAGDSFKHKRPLEVMWDRREVVLSAGVVFEPDDDPAGGAAGTGPACLLTSALS